MNPKHAQHFEAIKYSLRQSKDGVVVAFVVQPEDVRPELMALPVGARIMVAWSQIGDDEKPVPAEPPPPSKPKRKFSDLSLPEQAGIRCEDGRFERFVEEVYEVTWGEGADVATWVRNFLTIKSRAELSTNHEAANRWRKLEARYQQWLTDETHGASVNR